MLTPPMQDEGGCQRHGTQRNRGQNQQRDKLDLRQPTTALIDRHQQPVTMVTAVAGAPALVLVFSGGVSPESICFPVLCGLQQSLTGASSIPRLANTAEAPNAVDAAAAMEARLADTVVQVDGAETSAETGGTDARETVHAIQAGGAVSARHHQAVVHVGLAAASSEASQAVTGQLCSKAVSVLAPTAIFTRRPRDQTRGV